MMYNDAVKLLLHKLPGSMLDNRLEIMELLKSPISQLSDIADIQGHYGLLSSTRIGVLVEKDNELASMIEEALLDYDLDVDVDVVHTVDDTIGKGYLMAVLEGGENDSLPLNVSMRVISRFGMHSPAIIILCDGQ